MIKIIFFGTPSIAAQTLQSCIDDPHIEVCAIVSQPDKPIGRKQILTPTPVKSLGEKQCIPVYQPEKIKNNTELHEILRAYQAQYFVVIAYGRILPRSVLDIPTHGCLNLHGSLLPLYRGAAPIQYALLHGETCTGITLMEMNENMDEGDIIATHLIPIDRYETSGSLFEKMGRESGPFLCAHLPLLAAGKLSHTHQDHSRSTYTRMIQKEDGLLDFNEDAITLFHRWQAYTPWPGIYTYWNNKKLIIESCDFTLDISATIGTVTQLHNNQIGIGCGKGVLILHTLKLEGKKSQHIVDFVRGYPDFLKAYLTK